MVGSPCGEYGSEMIMSVASLKEVRESIRCFEEVRVSIRCLWNLTPDAKVIEEYIYSQKIDLLSYLPLIERGYSDLYFNDIEVVREPKKWYLMTTTTNSFLFCDGCCFIRLGTNSRSKIDKQMNLYRRKKVANRLGTYFFDMFVVPGRRMVEAVILGRLLRTEHREYVPIRDAWIFRNKESSE